MFGEGGGGGQGVGWFFFSETPNGDESDTGKVKKEKAETFGLLNVIFAVIYPFKATAISQAFWKL